MTQPFKIRRGEILLQAAFQKPAFSLLDDLPGLYENLFESFSRDGLRLANLGFEQGTGNFGDVQLWFHIMNFKAAVRIRLDRIEVQSLDALQVTDQDVHEMSLRLITILKRQCQKIAFRFYSMDVGYHGTLDGASKNSDFPGRFTRSAPSGLGPVLSSGVAFYCGPENERITSSLTIDRSSVLEDGLFIKLSASWDATRLSIDELVRVGPEYLDRSFRAIGLELRKK